MTGDILVSLYRAIRHMQAQYNEARLDRDHMMAEYLLRGIVIRQSQAQTILSK